MIRYFKENLKLIINSEAFKSRPFIIFIRCLILFFSIIFKIKFSYKVNLKFSKFIYTFKPYKKSGLGGRGQFIFREYYEPFLNIGHKLFNKKINFIDIGCSRGFFSMYLLNLKNLRSKGICIDPLKNALDDFREILKLNGNKANLIQGVISNSAGKKINLYRANDFLGYYSVIKNVKFADKNITHKFQVNSFTIDQLIFKKKKLNRVDFIKIDSEGAEFEILTKSVKTLKRFKPAIYFETTRKAKKILSLLKKYGYEFFTISKDKKYKLNKISSGNILALHKNSNFKI